MKNHATRFNKAILVFITIIFSILSAEPLLNEKTREQFKGIINDCKNKNFTFVECMGILRSGNLKRILTEAPNSKVIENIDNIDKLENFIGSQHDSMLPDFLIANAKKKFKKIA